MSDPFTIEVICSGLHAVADEMFAVMRRTAKSPIIYEVLDFGTGVTDGAGNLAAMGYGTPFLLCAIESIVKGILTRYAAETLAPGDIFITNDPYNCVTTHLNDVGLVMPVFADGRIFAFVAVNAHWTDIGGREAGSLTTDSSDIFQEGLQIPPVHLFRAGNPVAETHAFIKANVRLPDLSMGDLAASVASLRVGDKRMRELCDRHGSGLIGESIALHQDYSHRLVMLGLKKIPTGIFSAHDFIDEDGHGNNMLPIQVKVTVRADKFIADFTGSAPQAMGPINTTKLGLLSAARCAFMAVTDPHAPANGGCFRDVEVICPDGTVFSAERPAPLGTYFDGMAHAVELIWKALAEVVPQRLTAGHMTSVCLTKLAGHIPKTGEYFLLVETLAGGWGAANDRDGVAGTGCVANGETYNIPVEVRERQFGVLCHRYELHDDGGGDGQYRGGRGLLLEYEITAESAQLTTIFGRRFTGPWGLKGGGSGGPNHVVVTRVDGTQEDFGRMTGFTLRRGDRVAFYTASGGGYGAPADRSAAALAIDVADGYLTDSQCNSRYAGAR
jgi:N-methylhydantoinase B